MIETYCCSTSQEKSDDARSAAIARVAETTEARRKLSVLPSLCSPNPSKNCSRYSARNSNKTAVSKLVKDHGYSTNESEIEKTYKKIKINCSYELLLILLILKAIIKSWLKDIN